MYLFGASGHGKVIKDILNANQVFTVWAPEITDAEAQEWIDTYKR